MALTVGQLKRILKDVPDEREIRIAHLVDGKTEYPSLDEVTQQNALIILWRWSLYGDEVD